MKKIISLALAASMVAGMSVASFARTTDKFEEPYVDQSSELYVYNADGKSVLEKKDEGEITTDMPVAIMVENPLSNSEMKRYKAYFEAGVGADFVESVELKYHKYATENGTKPGTEETYKLDSRMEVAPGTGVYDLGRSAYEKQILKAWNAPEESKRDYEVRVYAVVDNEAMKDGFVEELEYEADYNIVIVNKKDALSFDVVDLTDTNNYSVAEFNKTDRALAKNNADQLYKNAKKIKAGKDEETKYEQDYAWFVVINFKTEAEKMDEDVMGKVTVAKSSAVAKDNFEDRDYHKTLNFVNVNYDNSHKHEDKLHVSQELEDFEFELNGQQAMLVVDTTGVKDFGYCFTTKMNEKVWEKYSEPDYELYFYGWDAGKFNRTGDLYFYTDDAEFTADWHVYEIVDAKTGELKEIPAVYDEDEGTIKIRTRVLKNYVVSEEDLLAGESAPTEENAPTEVKPDKEIPNTGR